jgi:hypothetical protein
MAAVAERIRRELAARRAARAAFERAWCAALDAAAPTPDWRVALDATRAAWRAAYDGLPGPAGVRAVVAALVRPPTELEPLTLAAIRPRHGPAAGGIEPRRATQLGDLEVTSEVASAAS